jgi:AbrB family looped-hinge helix DNA binding protein
MKGQVTFPKVVRDRLQIKPEDRFKFFFHPDGVIILPKIPTRRLKGSVPKPARPVSLKEVGKFAAWYGRVAALQSAYDRYKKCREF